MKGAVTCQHCGFEWNAKWLEAKGIKECPQCTMPLSGGLIVSARTVRDFRDQLDSVERRLARLGAN
jgi:hypothetical protein